MAPSPSTFEERLHEMDSTFNERLSLLQAESDLRRRKSSVLSARTSSLRVVQQRCRLLHRHHARLSALILAKRSEIESLDARRHDLLDRHRAERGKIAELERRGRENNAIFAANRKEMESFGDKFNRFLADSNVEVGALRGCVSELEGTVKRLLQGGGGNSDGRCSEIDAAERRKAELLEAKERLEGALASNYRLKSLLQKQLSKRLGRR